MQFRNLAFSICTLLIFLTISSCQTEVKEEPSVGVNKNESEQTKYGTFKRYHHKKGSYSLLVPEDWKINKKKKAGCAFVSPNENESDNFQEFFDIYIKSGRFIKNEKGEMEAENLSSKDWLMNHFEVLKYDLPALKIEEQGTILINDKEAAYLSFLKKKKGVSYKTTVYLLSTNNKAYIITSIIDVSKQPFYKPRISKMIKSLKF